MKTEYRKGRKEESGSVAHVGLLCPLGFLGGAGLSESFLFFGEDPCD